MTALDIAKDWLRYAKSDLNTANHMYNDVNPKETEISCYHSQQCAEKSLKSFLVAKNINPPRTHDLLELNNLCLVQEPEFSTMQQYCVFLNPYGVHVRYPNELAVDDAAAKSAIIHAQKIFDFCNLLINRVTQDNTG